MPYEEKLDIKACCCCNEKKLLNQWDMCESCSSRHAKLVFVDGKVMEKNSYNSRELKEVDSFTPEQVIEFLSEELQSSNARLNKFFETRRLFLTVIDDLKSL